MRLKLRRHFCIIRQKPLFTPLFAGAVLVGGVGVGRFHHIVIGPVILGHIMGCDEPVDILVDVCLVSPRAQQPVDDR